MAAPWETEQPEVKREASTKAPWETKSVETKSVAPWETKAASKAPWEDEGDDSEHRKPGLTWEKFKKAPGSALLSPLVGAVDFIAGAPEFVASTAAKVGGAFAEADTKGWTKPWDWDKIQNTGNKVGKFLFGPLSGIGTKTARALGADPIVGEAAEPLNRVIESSVEGLHEKTGIPKGAAAFAVDIGMIIVGEGLAKGAKKSGLTDKMTESTEKGRAKFREELDKKSADFQDAQERKAKETKSKEEVDPETGEIKDYKPGSKAEYDLEQRVKFAEAMDKRDELLRTDPTDPSKTLDMSNKEDVAKAKQHFFKQAADELGKTPKELRDLLDSTGAEFEYEPWTNFFKGEEGRAREPGKPKAEEDLRKFKERDQTAAESVMDEHQKEQVDLTIAKMEDLIDRFKKKYDELTEVKLTEEDRAEYKAKREAIDDKFKKEIVHLSEEAIINKALRETKVLQDYAKLKALDPMKDKSLYKDWAEDVKDTIGYTVRKHVSNALAASFDYLKMKEMANEHTQEQVWEAFQKNEVDKLTGDAKDLADFYSKVMKEFEDRALKAGTIKGAVEDYATRIIDMSHLTDEQQASVLRKLSEQFSGPSAPTKSKFGKSRTMDFNTLQQFMKENDLKFKTTNLSEVFKEYAASMNKAIENSKLIEGLKEIRIKGDPIFIEIKEGEYIPPNYKKLVGKGPMENYMVHPDIAPALKHVIDAQDPNVLVKAISTLTNATKRLNIGFSFFHGSSLTLASLMANAPKDALMNAPELIKNYKDGMLRDKETGRLKPEVRQWVDEGGLMFGISEDTGRGAYTEIAKNVDKYIGKITGVDYELAQNALKPGSAVQHTLDHVTWTVLHDGLKYLTAEKYLEKARIDHPNVPDAVHRQEISRAVNNIYGGLDWFDVARQSEGVFQKMAMNLYSPEGRRAFQILMFAPDWTLSTVRAFTSALPKNLLKPSTWDISKGYEGITKPLTAGDYARRYQMRYAMYSLVLANGLNLALSGHYIWDNKDPTTIDLGDGRSMAWAKHPSEPLHWLFNFQNTLYNKLGLTPKELVEGGIALKQHTPFGQYAAGTAKRMMPFTLSTILDPKQDLTSAVSGFAGLPIRGKKRQDIHDRWERAKRNVQRKLGVKIVEPQYDEDEEDEE